MSKETPGPWHYGAGGGKVSAYAKETRFMGIKMTLIGSWSDLAAYYRGSDGNAWCWSACTGRWANEGDCGHFVAHFKILRRGQLLEGVKP